MKHRIDWVATHRMIINFLTKEVAELKIERNAERLMTSLKEIAKHTKLNVKTVRAHISEIRGKRTDGKVVVIKINKTEVVIKLR